MSLTRIGNLDLGFVQVRAGESVFKSLCPVATFTAWIIDKASLTMLLIGVSIQAVPESIFVVGHWVETIGFASTEPTATTRAAAAARAATATTATASTTRSCCDWRKGLCRS